MLISYAIGPSRQVMEGQEVLERHARVVILASALDALYRALHVLSFDGFHELGGLYVLAVVAVE